MSLGLLDILTTAPPFSSSSSSPTPGGGGALDILDVLELSHPFRSGGAVTVAADLLEAAVAYLAESPSVIAAAPGGVWADEAPVGTPLPFAVISEPDGDSNNESGAASWEPVTLQVAVYAADKGVARAARRAIAAALNDAALSFAAGTLLHLRSDGRTSGKDPDRGPGGCDVWQEVQAFVAVVGHG